MRSFWTEQLQKKLCMRKMFHINIFAKLLCGELSVNSRHLCIKNRQFSANLIFNLLQSSVEDLKLSLNTIEALHFCSVNGPILEPFGLGH